jgi:hypothetical protein
MTEISHVQKLNETAIFLDNTRLALNAVTEAIKSIPPSLPETGREATARPLKVAGLYLALEISAVGAAYAEATGNQVEAEILIEQGMDATKRLEALVG